MNSWTVIRSPLFNFMFKVIYRPAPILLIVSKPNLFVFILLLVTVTLKLQKAF